MAFQNEYENTYTKQKTSFKVFRDTLIALAGFATEDENLLRDIWTASEGYITSGIDLGLIPDILAGSTDAPQSYKNYVINFNKIKGNNTGITTIAELNQARTTYKQVLSRYGLNDIANNATADQFLINNVSAAEAAARMETAFNAVKYADAALKEQLKTFYPSLTDNDIAKSILGVGKSVAELQQQINVAGIKAESATAGLQSTLDANQLAAQGVTRAEARTGFQNVASSLANAQGAAARAGQDATTIQTELEKEQLLGMKSKRRAQLAAREQGLMAGQSGAGQSALSKSSVGKF
jgi:hypothetical protein